MILRPVWRFRSIPEIEHLDPPERNRILRGAGAKSALARLYSLAIILGIIGAGLLTSTVRMSLPRIWLGIIGIAAAMVIAAVVFQVLMLRIRIEVRLAILEGRRGKRLPACLRCGYDLVGTPGAARCPECGAPSSVPGNRR